jgi:hypothetical protein
MKPSETYTIKYLQSTTVHAFRVRLFLEQGWDIMSTGMGVFQQILFKLSIRSMEIGNIFPKITQQSQNFPLSNLRSSLSAHTIKFSPL